MPLIDAVAPVWIKAPLFPLTGSIGNSLKVTIAARENPNAAAAFVSNEVRTSSSVTSRNFLNTPEPAFHTATRIGAPLKCFVISLNNGSNTA